MTAGDSGISSFQMFSLIPIYQHFHSFSKAATLLVSLEGFPVILCNFMKRGPMMSGDFKPKTKVMALGYISKVQRNVNLKCFIRFRIHSFYFQTLNFLFNEVPQLFMAEFMYKQKTLLL